MTHYDPQKHHRRSIRLKGWDYRRPGYYFVTMVVHNRECLFGRVVNGKMVLNAFGKIADFHWKKLPNHFKHIELDEFRIMPNHLHGIIHIVRWPDGVVLDDGSVGAKDFPDQFNTGKNTSLPNENMPNGQNGVGNNVMDVRAKDFPEQFNTGKNASLPNENMPNGQNGVGNPSPLPRQRQQSQQNGGMHASPLRLRRPPTFFFAFKKNICYYS